MARPLRDLNPNAYHLVTVRTLEAIIWMIPNNKLNDVIGGIIARYQEIYNVTIYAYCILGNHLHFLVKANEPNLDQFMENVLREIARRVNRQIKRRGYFWSRRYDDQVILSEEDLLEAFLYVVTNPAKHGLITEIRSWPGLHCFHQVLNETPKLYPFVHYSREDKKGNPEVSFHKLSLTSLPQFTKLSKKDRLQELEVLITTRQKKLVKERREKGQGFLGAKAVRSQPPGRKPITVSYSPRPICYTKDPEIRRHYKADRRAFRDAYCEASELFRSGELNTEFPSHCFKPPLHRIPKAV